MTIDDELSSMISDIAREHHLQSIPELPLFLHARGISTLFHFTPLQNIPSIFKHGLLGLDELRAKNIEFKNSDQSRSDPIANGICISLTRPNSYMLSSKLNQGYALALLELQPAQQILSEVCFIASPGNFGRWDHKNRVLEWPEKYCGGSGLANMFLNEPLRKSYDLEASQPTDPQAELIFLNSIPARFIAKVILPAGKDYANAQTVRDLIRDLPKGVLVESQNKRNFPQFAWNDSRRVKEFEERKWQIDWELDLK